MVCCSSENFGNGREGHVVKIAEVRGEPHQRSLAVHLANGRLSAGAVGRIGAQADLHSALDEFRNARNLCLSGCDKTMTTSDSAVGTTGM
jgi:hypothetical protein